jgi:hypothetical protein
VALILYHSLVFEEEEEENKKRIFKATYMNIQHLHNQQQKDSPIVSQRLPTSPIQTN